MTLRIHIRTSARRPPATVNFNALVLGPVPRMWSLAGSVAGHLVVVLLLAVVSRHVSQLMKDDQVDWSRYKVEPLRLHLQDPLFFRASAHEKSSPAPTPGQRANAPGPAPADADVAAAAAASPVAPRVVVPRRLELPPPRQVAQNAPVILQPDFQPQLTPPPAVLPPLAFWARQGAELPKPPPPKETVVPGRTEAASAQPKLAAPPVAAIPNREQRVADVNVSMPPPQSEAPQALPVPNSATTPVRLRDAKESQSASLDKSSGQAANVMSLAQERRDVRDVQIPRGLQNIPNSQAQEGAAPAVTANAGGAANGSAAAGTGTGTGTDTKSKGSNPAGNPSASAKGTPAAGQNASQTAPQNASQDAPSKSAADDGKREPGIPAGTTSVATRPVSRPDVTRIEHPTNGNFDVVIMQSATRDDLPDVGGMLTGTPVYTVYLHVGDHKEWLLEYCVPVTQAAQTNPYEINVEDASPLTPPYPISTVIPKDLAAQKFARQIIVHGVLTANGTLRNIKVPDANNTVANQILALLGEWQFRPVLRNKKPIDVEILLVIPPRV